MTLETIVHNLRDGYNQLVPGTMLHADQLMAEQVNDRSLRERSFYVADGPLYSLEEGVPTLWLTRHTPQTPNNLVLRHLNDEINSSHDQLVNTGDYRPNVEEARAAMQASGTLRIDLTQLRLQGNDAEYRYLVISTTDYDSLNSEERNLAERFYGQGAAFVTAMQTLQEAGIENTRVHVINPEYVKQKARQGPLVRAAWRSFFNINANSYAVDRNFNLHYGLRGVRSVVAAGAPKNPEVPPAPSEMTPARCYQVLLADPESAVGALSDATAQGLAEILAKYSATRTQ